jgi:hypothetical protein
LRDSSVLPWSSRRHLLIDDLYTVHETGRFSEAGRREIAYFPIMEHDAFSHLPISCFATSESRTVKFHSTGATPGTVVMANSPSWVLQTHPFRENFCNNRRGRRRNNCTPQATPYKAVVSPRSFASPSPVALSYCSLSGAMRMARCPLRQFNIEQASIFVQDVTTGRAA